MLTIHTMTFNEETILQYTIDHYRSKFPNCSIVIRDDQSTDNTVNIAAKNNCTLIPYNSNKQIDDFVLRDLKNSCWKSSDTNWNLVIDPDEILNISEQELLEEEKLGTTIIKTRGFNMVNLNEDFDLYNIKNGVRDVLYDKTCLFNKNFVQDINFQCGAHKSNPIGNIKFSDKVYDLYHFKFLNTEYVVNRLKTTATRLSENNKKHDMGTYCFFGEEKLKKIIEDTRRASTRVIP